MGNTTIFPTSYFPPIVIMAAISHSAERGEEIVIEKHETFPKQTFRNRTVILTANGSMALTVPVIRPGGTHTPTAEIGISYSERWNTNHMRAIDAAYNASPYYEYYRDEIEKIVMTRYEKLIELNGELLKMLLKKIKIKAEIKESEEYHKSNYYHNDYREKYSYKKPERLPIATEYTQVFCDRMPFERNLGILDLLFNMGPETNNYLLKLEV